MIVIKNDIVWLITSAENAQVCLEGNREKIKIYLSIPY
jgi:hypothetical protein